MEIEREALAGVGGGFGLRDAYRGAVKEIAADVGGWKLANQMYGGTSTWQDKLRARAALKDYLNGSDRLPSWAPQW